MPRVMSVLLYTVYFCSVIGSADVMYCEGIQLGNGEFEWDHDDLL